MMQVMGSKIQQTTKTAGPTLVPSERGMIVIDTVKASDSME